MARKKKPPEHENLERWLVSYADFITLLFAFFTTLYAISTVDAKKMGKLVMSMQAAFDPTGFASSASTSVNPMNMGTGSGRAAQDAMKRIKSMISMRKLKEAFNGVHKGDKGAGPGGKKKKLTEIKEDVTKIILDDALNKKVRIILKQNAVIVSLAEAGFFASGDEHVRKDSLPLLDKLAQYIAMLPNLVRVEGHTDNVAIHTARFPSNWELSTARATFIIAYFIEQHDIDPKRLAAAGYSEYRPVDTNETVEGRSRNRRVDIIILAATDPEELASF